MSDTESTSGEQQGNPGTTETVDDSTSDAARQEQVIMDTQLARSLAAGVTSDGKDYTFAYWQELERMRRKQWLESDDFKRAKERRDAGVWIGLGSLVLGGCGAIVLAIVGIGWRWPIAVGVCAVIVGIAVLSWSSYNMRAASREFAPVEQPEAPKPPKPSEKWLNDPNLQNLITLNREQMKVYHELATKQAAKASRNSRLAIAIGFVVLIVGAAFAIQANDPQAKIVVGSLAAVGSLMSGYIGQTFLRAEDRAMGQLNFYFHQPLVTSYMLAAERLTGKIHENRRDAMFSTVVGKLLQVGLADATDVHTSRPRSSTTRAPSDGTTRKAEASNGSRSAASDHSLSG